MHRFWGSGCEHLWKAWFCLQQPSWANCFDKRSEMLWFTQCGSEFYVFGQESSLTGSTFWNHMIRTGQYLSLQRRWFFKRRGRKEWLYRQQYLSYIHTSWYFTLHTIANHIEELMSPQEATGYSQKVTGHSLKKKNLFEHLRDLDWLVTWIYYPKSRLYYLFTTMFPK